MTPEHNSQSLWRLALQQSLVWSRALMVGLPIGCLRALINQGDVWWHHQGDGLTLVTTIVSPLVTFSVALVSATATWVEKQQSHPAKS